MPNFEAFIGKVNSGLMLNNRFAVTCGKLGGDAHLLCQSATLPVISIQYFEYKQTGHGMKIPNNFTFEPLSLTFIVDKNGSPYKEAYQWIDSILTEKYEFNEMSSYEEDITVEEYAPDDSLVGTWKYQNCYPTQITPKEKTNKGTDVDTFTMTFMYEQSSYS